MRFSIIAEKLILFKEMKFYKFEQSESIFFQN